MFISEEDCSFGTRAFELASNKVHAMEFIRMRTFEAMCSQIRKGMDNILQNHDNIEF